ncbi:MAG: hypothetical protein E7397_04725 [Ruminococcaceae bacterium]|nr:hypothetical protein [Oscillospiraceae bacterium]
MKKTEQELTAFYEEKVPVMIRRPAGMPIGASHTVTHNGKNYQIQYDEQVMIPRKIALILQEKERNEKKLELRMANLAGTVQNLDGE